MGEEWGQKAVESSALLNLILALQVPLLNRNGNEWSQTNSLASLLS